MNTHSDAAELHQLIDTVLKSSAGKIGNKDQMMEHIRVLAIPHVINMVDTQGISPLGRVVAQMVVDIEDEKKLIDLKAVFRVLTDKDANCLLPVRPGDPKTILEECLELRHESEILYTLPIMARYASEGNPLLTDQDGNCEPWIICRHILGKMQSNLPIKNNNISELHHFLRVVNPETHNMNAVARKKLDTLNRLWSVASQVDPQGLEFDVKGPHIEIFWGMHDIISESVSPYFAGGRDDVEEAILPLVLKAYHQGMSLLGDTGQLMTKVERAVLDATTDEIFRHVSPRGPRL